MAKRKKSQRGRKPNVNPSIVFRLTLSLNPIEHAPVVALLNSVPSGQRSKMVVEALMGMTDIVVRGSQVEHVAVEVQEVAAEKEVYIADDGW
jgi:hypothetical protein